MKKNEIKKKKNRYRQPFAFVIFFCFQFMVFSGASAAFDNASSRRLSTGQTPFIPEKLAEDLQGGSPREVLILFDETVIRQEIRAMGKNPKERLAMRAGRFRSLKEEVLTRLPMNDAILMRDYSHLPMSSARIHGISGLNWLRARPDILAIYENSPIYYDLNESLPFINQPEVAESSFTGEGAAVAVIDTGVLYTNVAFGSCTAPGLPESCRVAASIDIAPDDGQLDPQGHGTNVSAIVAGVAPGADLVVLDIFDGSSSTADLLLGAINWVLVNHSTYNIKTVNLSLGDGSLNSTPCDKWWKNPYLIAIEDLRDIGITVVASSGNDGYTDGIGQPACTPGVISVGAVYDADVGSRAWSVCTDTTTTADQVTCFSNSAYFLSSLAPGVLITAGGYIASGTSQACPHMAGATAVLAAAQPLFSPDDIAERLITTGVPVIDYRTGYEFPRLDLAAALSPEIEAVAMQPAEEDVPFLPVWAFFALGSAVMYAGIRKQPSP